ncbi:MAG: APC family permease, partial [Acidimicrobiales bacterium]
RQGFAVLRRQGQGDEEMQHTDRAGHQPATAGALAAMAAGTGELEHGSLRTWDAVAISISVLAPAMAMQLNTGGVAAVAGGSTPLAFLLGGIACLALAVVVIGFTRRMASAGYAYTYASRSLGKDSGFMAGWLYAFGMACFVPMTMAGVGALSASLLGLGGDWWFWFFLMGMALLVVLGAIRVKVTTKVQLLVGVLTVAVFVIVDAVVTAKGGAHGLSAAPFTFNHTTSHGFHGVFYGLILGVTSFIGFETAADFGEETAHPRRAIPIAVIAAVLFAIVFYVWTTYATTIGYGVNALQHNPIGWVNNGVAGVATRYVSSAFGTLVQIGALLSAFIVCVACATASSRTLFAMGREGVIPRWFSHTNRRMHTPVNATATVAVLATIVAAIVGFVFGTKALGGDAFTVYYLMATIGTLAVVLVYFALCLGGIAFFKKTSRRFNPLLHGVVPLIGAVIFAAAWYGSVFPMPAAPINSAAYVTGIWFFLGLAVLAYLRARRREAIERIGSILGEEGGDIEELDAPVPGGSAAAGT